jgi:hypothetical protein
MQPKSTICRACQTDEIKDITATAQLMALIRCIHNTFEVHERLD